MRILGVVAAVLVLGACGPKTASGGADTTLPTAPAQSTPTSPATTTPPAPGDATLPPLDTPARAWHFAAAPTGADDARLDALNQALGGPATLAGDPAQSWTYASSTTKAAPQAPADATAVAERVWGAAGVDVATLDVSVSADGSTVTGTERLDGVASPLPFIVVVGANGTVVSASGHLVSPTAMGPLERVGTAAALSQLTAAPAGDDRGEQQPSLRPGPTPAVPPLSPQPTTEPAPEPSVVDRVLAPVTAVAETYLVMPATDGGTWLLPGYRFAFDDGSSRSVLAVAGPPPADAASPPATTCDGGPDCGIGDFVGLPEDQAAARAAAEGRAFRVAERDGVEQLLTADYSPDRVNVAITDGTVTRAWLG